MNVSNRIDRQLRTYGGAFKAFSGETLEFSDTRYSPDGGRAIVKGQFTQTNGNKVPVDFRLYENKESGDWLVYDAVISGLSMVKTYRTQLSDRSLTEHQYRRTYYRAGKRTRQTIRP